MNTSTPVPGPHLSLCPTARGKAVEHARKASEMLSAVEASSDISPDPTAVELAGVALANAHAATALAWAKIAGNERRRPNELRHTRGGI